MFLVSLGEATLLFLALIPVAIAVFAAVAVFKNRRSS